MISQGLHVLDETECYQLLRQRTFGRVGLRHGDIILVLPVFYALVDHDVVFRTSPGAKLDAAVLEARVSFEVDDPVPGWSVLLVGYAHEITDPDEAARAVAALGHDWPAGERNRLVRIVADRVSGRRLDHR
jgi:nitroimidazol reductase NimA-like FMN-containing flavoprotein (pyridoxamine 5'-phosphate oxidase superfamily)